MIFTYYSLELNTENSPYERKWGNLTEFGAYHVELVVALSACIFYIKLYISRQPAANRFIYDEILRFVKYRRFGVRNDYKCYSTIRSQTI